MFENVLSYMKGGSVHAWAVNEMSKEDVGGYMTWEDFEKMLRGRQGGSGIRMLDRGPVGWLPLEPWKKKRISSIFCLMKLF